MLPGVKGASKFDKLRNHLTQAIFLRAYRYKSCPPEVKGANKFDKLRNHLTQAIFPKAKRYKPGPQVQVPPPRGQGCQYVSLTS